MNMPELAWMALVLHAPIVRPCLLERVVTYFKEVYSLSGSFQVLQWNNENTIEKKDGYWCRQKTDYRERMRGCICTFVIENKGSLIEWMTATEIKN